MTRPRRPACSDDDHGHQGEQSIGEILQMLVLAIVQMVATVIRGMPNKLASVGTHTAGILGKAARSLGKDNQCTHFDAFARGNICRSKWIPETGMRGKAAMVGDR